MSAEKKLVSNLEQHPAYDFYQTVRIFDPHQLHTIEHDIVNYDAIRALSNPPFRQ